MFGASSPGPGIRRRRRRSTSRRPGVLLEQAREELARGASAAAVKAYASWRDGRRLSSHRELWEYTGRMMAELGGRVSDAWAQADAMHVCFYGGLV